MKIVVIEWDGKQPSTTYYNGLRRLHLRVRGDKNKDPLVRRTREEDHSVIAQEGAVLVESESLARQVAHLARECGARTVMVGEVEFDSEARGRQMTQQEQEVVNRFNKAFRQRGRPIETEEREWVVSCPECASTSVVRSEKLVIQCPNCGGLRAASRVGYKHVFHRHPQTLDEWKNMYFVEGYFETPEVTQDPHIICEDFNKDVKLNGENLSVFEGLKSSEMVNKYLVPHLDMPDNRQLMNDIFIAYRYYTQKDRQHPRTEMVVKLLETGIDPKFVPLFESGGFEVVDSAISGHRDLIKKFYQTL